jgi:type I restriction enzyme S subunit
MDMMLEQFKTIFDRPEKVKRLRETILDLAVRGKLVKQDPNDEPASVLLERIKEEKERLVKEGKIKREKPLPEIREAEKPYELPKSWSIEYMQSLTSCITCGLASTPKYVDKGKIFLSAKNIKPYKFMPQDHRFISKEDFQKLTKQNKPEIDDILLTRVGAGIGEAAIIDQNLEFAIYVSLTLIKPIKKHVHSKYLLHWINSPKGVAKAVGNTFGKGVSQGNLNVNQVRRFLVPIPPIDEQIRIVEKVDSLMIFCDKLEKALEKKAHYGELSSKSVFNAVGNVSTVKELEETLRFILLNFKDLSLGDNAVKELKNCILQLAVQGKLVPQDPNDEPAEVLLEKIKEEKERLIKEGKIKREKPLGEISDTPYLIPSRWCLVRLGNLTKVIEYGTSTKADLDQNKIPVLRMNNIIDGRLNYENLKYVDSDIKDLPKLYLNNKDLLFNRTNSYELVGKTAVFKGLNNIMTFASYLIRVELFNDMVNADYVNIVMNSNLYRITQIEPQITQQNGQANFNGTKLKSTIIPLPPLNEQKRIVEKVNSLISLCDELEKKIEKQKSYSNRLMESILKYSFKA